MATPTCPAGWAPGGRTAPTAGRRPPACPLRWWATAPAPGGPTRCPSAPAGSGGGCQRAAAGRGASGSVGQREPCPSHRRTAGSPTRLWSAPQQRVGLAAPKAYVGPPDCWHPAPLPSCLPNHTGFCVGHPALAQVAGPVQGAVRSNPHGRHKGKEHAAGSQAGPCAGQQARPHPHVGSNAAFPDWSQTAWPCCNMSCATEMRTPRSTLQCCHTAAALLGAADASHPAGHPLNFCRQAPTAVPASLEPRQRCSLSHAVHLPPMPGCLPCTSHQAAEQGTPSQASKAARKCPSRHSWQAGPTCSASGMDSNTQAFRKSMGRISTPLFMLRAASGGTGWPLKQR